jgi:hypothetical protein
MGTTSTRPEHLEHQAIALLDLPDDLVALAREELRARDGVLLHRGEVHHGAARVDRVRALLVHGVGPEEAREGIGPLVLLEGHQQRACDVGVLAHAISIRNRPLRNRGFGSTIST